MVYYWLSWFTIICLSFFSVNKTGAIKHCLFVLLLNIIFINTQIQLGAYLFSLPFLYCFVLCWLIMITKGMSYINYYLLFCLILVYIGLRFILITSPIWLFVNPYLLITTLLSILLFFCIKANLERIYILTAVSLTGEWLYAHNVNWLGWTVVIGDSHLFTSIYIAIFLLVIFDKLFFTYQPIEL